MIEKLLRTLAPERFSVLDTALAVPALMTLANTLAAAPIEEVSVFGSTLVCLTCV